MREELKRLMEIQRLDLQILSLNKKREEIPHKLHMLRERFNEEKKAYEVTLKEIETLEKDLRSKERKLAATNETLRKYRAQIYNVKTQKEADALEHEISRTKEEIAHLEDKILSLMEEIDGVRKRGDIEKEKITKDEEELKKKEAEYNGELERITKELTSLNDTRMSIIPRISEELLTLYEKLREKKDGIGIVLINDGVCGGCFMKLPPQVINEVKISSRPIRCENCLRILHFEE